MPTIWRILIATFAALVVAANAAAQRVTLEAESTQGFVNEPTRLVLRIDDAENFAEPEFPKVDGLEFRRLPGQQSSTSVQFINGRTTQRRTVELNYEVTPARTGRFEIPPVSVKVGDRTISTLPVTLTVGVSETGDLMLVQVSSEPEKLFVGEAGSLNLEIAVRQYRDANLGITLDEGQTWSLVDSQSTFGVFTPVVQKMAAEGRRPRGVVMVLGDTEYVVYTISKPFDPIASGTPDVGDIRIRMQYPTRLRRGADAFFGDRITLAGARPISATPARVAVDVLDPPTDARPSSWNGAVGNFELSVTAKPTEVAVGDPITLTIRLSDRSGRAALAGLRAPALAEQPAFAGAFRIPGDAASGTVEGRSKVFTQTIRALSDATGEIPPVEFTFLDPLAGEYRTVRSEAIPITVKAGAVVQVAQDLPPGAGAPAKPEFTKVEGGMLANASLGECVASETVGGPWLVASAALPLLAAAAGLAASRLGGSRGGERGRIRRHARATAEAALARAATPEAIESAMLAFVAARCGSDSRGVSRKDARALLSAHGAHAAGAAADALDELLRECERARYFGGSVDAARARAVLAEIESATESIELEPEAAR